MSRRFLPLGKSAFTLRAVVTLAVVDLKLRLFGFRGLYRAVKQYRPPSLVRKPIPDLTRAVCTAVDRASVYYVGTTTCLQRSATVALMLRRFGVEAELVIGCRAIPFASHAWVEVDQNVVNDSDEVRSIYAVLDRL